MQPSSAFGGYIIRDSPCFRDPNSQIVSNNLVHSRYLSRIPEIQNPGEFLAFLGNVLQEYSSKVNDLLAGQHPGNALNS